MNAPAEPTGLHVAAGLADIPPFTGEDGSSANDWLKNMACIAALCHWDDATRLLVVRAKLRQPAAMWLESASPVSWQGFQTAFLDRFGEDPEASYLRFERCSQRPGESTRAYRDRFVALAARADRLEDLFLPTRFFRGLARSIRKQMLPYKPVLHTLDDIVRSASCIEQWHNSAYVDSPATHDTAATARDGQAAEPK
jgi:hypothetical protein